jgi:hypothetical protein
VTTTAIPKYGVVMWLDASGVSGKIAPGKARKALIMRRSRGQLFIDPDGTLIILHEDDDKYGFQKAVEATVIPMGWVQTIVPLTEGEPSDLHRPEKPSA